MRILPAGALFCCVVLSACEAEPRAPDAVPSATPAPVAPTPEAAPPGVPLADVGDLQGEYRVAAIDDAELGDYGIALSVDGARLSFEPTCAGFVWRIEDEGAGDALRFVRVPQYPPLTPDQPPPPPCAVAVRPQLRQLGEAIDAGERAWRTPSNGVLIEGGGRSVLLFSQ